MRPLYFADSKSQFDSIRTELMAAITRVAESGRYILGEEVVKFEQAFSKWVGVKHCISVANGTDAIVIALRALSVKPGDEVITVSHSAVATTAAIEQVGAVPVFVDIEASTRCINPALIEQQITSKTKAIIPVHIYGHPANMPEIVGLAAKYQISVIEDCAQAHGAKISNRQVGTFGDLSAFSFYPTKNLGALGDGGAVLTNNDQLAAQAKIIRQYGWAERYISSTVGQNSRLDEMQAAILLAKLPYLERWNERRRALAYRYISKLSGASQITLPVIDSSILHAMHLFVIEVERRDDLQSFLAHHGVHCGIHYPQAIHQQPAYLNRIRGAENLAVTERLYRRILTLPMYPELLDEDVDRVCALILEWDVVKM